MFRIPNPERKYVFKPVNLIMAKENKAPTGNLEQEGEAESKRSGNCKLADEKL